MVTHRARTVAWLTLPLIALSACSSPTQLATSTSSSTGDSGQVAATNCGKESTLLSQTRKMYINDDNIIALTLAAGGAKETTTVSSIDHDISILKAKYGTETANGPNNVPKDCPTLESILADTPDLVVAGRSYGFSEGKNLTPNILSEKGIPSYLPIKSCRQEGTTKCGIADLWEVVRIDIINLGTITGYNDVAKMAVDDMDTRLKTVQRAAQPEKKFVAFLFDTTKDNVFTSGKYDAPQATIEATDGVDATADVEGAWTNVNWEHLTAANSGIIVPMEYPARSYQEKIDALKPHPAIKGLTTVRGERFVNLPYAMWIESPLSIDATEYLHEISGKHGLASASDVSAHLETSADLPGRDKLS